MQKKVIKTDLALVDDAKALQKDVNNFISKGGSELKKIEQDVKTIEKMASSLKTDYRNLNTFKFDFLNKIAPKYSQMYDEALKISQKLGVRVLDNPDFLRAEKAVKEGNRMVDLIDKLEDKVKAFNKI